MAGTEAADPGEAALEAQLLVPGQNGAGRIRRLGSLFRHAAAARTDEHAFETCAAAHDYAGRPVCDGNGSSKYRAEAVILRELLKVCADCSADDRETLRLEIADRFLRGAR